MVAAIIVNRYHKAMPDSTRPQTVATWLAICCAMVAVMVVVGGITRLTESGLSIVYWKPISGMIPPLTEQDWQAELEHYRSSPQYQKINRGMSLSEFKTIFWWEFIHRQVGRIIGLVFILPFAWYLWRGYLRGALAWRCAGFLALGGLQGFFGWYMVKSGLIQDPAVSPYRLALHLSTAFVLFGWMAWTVWQLRVLARTQRPPAPALSAETRPLFIGAVALLVLLSVQIVLGAFVAGLDAGLVYNMFPKMGERLVPPELWFMEPAWRNIFENPVTAQFFHRWTGVAVVIAITLYAALAWMRGIRHPVIPVLVVLAWGMMFLGIATLIGQVPIVLASLHQFGALVLFGTLLYVMFALVYGRFNHFAVSLRQNKTLCSMTPTSPAR